MCLIKLNTHTRTRIICKDERWHRQTHTRFLVYRKRHKLSPSHTPAHSTWHRMDEESWVRLDIHQVILKVNRSHAAQRKNTSSSETRWIHCVIPSQSTLLHPGRILFFLILFLCVACLFFCLFLFFTVFCLFLSLFFNGHYAQETLSDAVFTNVCLKILCMRLSLCVNVCVSALLFSFAGCFFPNPWSHFFFYILMFKSPSCQYVYW